MPAGAQVPEEVGAEDELSRDKAKASNGRAPKATEIL